MHHSYLNASTGFLEAVPRLCKLTDTTVIVNAIIPDNANIHQLISVLKAKFCNHFCIAYRETGAATTNAIATHITKSLFISVINLAEVYKVGLSKKTENEADEMVHLMLSRCFIIPIDPTIALNAAKTNFDKKWGLGDSLIYESAKAHNLTLVTGDPHFKKEKDIFWISSKPAACRLVKNFLC